MTAPKYDPRIVWAALSPADQEQLGCASLTLNHTQRASHRVHGHAGIGFDSPECVAYDVIDRISPPLPVRENGSPPLPDLAVFGVKACRECGCTDEVGCPDGCYWVESDLCSRCAGKIARLNRLARP